MRSSIFIFAATFGSAIAAAYPQAAGTGTSPGPSGPSGPKPTGSNLPLGANCDPAVEGQCAGGADCYATNFMLLPRCGNFQSRCSSDAQCAFNTCKDGQCNGLKPTSDSLASSPTPSYSNSSSTGTPKILAVPTDPSYPGSSRGRYSNTTSTPTGYATSVVIVTGTPSPPQTPSPTPSDGSDQNSAGRLSSGFPLLFVVAIGSVFL